MNLAHHTLVERIAHPGVDFMNEDVIQTQTNRHDIVPCQWAIVPVQKMPQPNAKIRRKRFHDISTSVAVVVVSSARFYLGRAVGWAQAALVRELARPAPASP